MKHLAKFRVRPSGLFPQFSVKWLKHACVLYVELEMSFFVLNVITVIFGHSQFPYIFLIKAEKKSEDCCWMMNYNYFDESFRNFHASAFINSISTFFVGIYLFLFEFRNKYSWWHVSMIATEICRQFCCFFNFLVVIFEKFHIEQVTLKSLLIKVANKRQIFKNYSQLMWDLSK